MADQHRHASALEFTADILRQSRLHRADPPLVRGPRRAVSTVGVKAETGKTAAAMVAGSVWGCHRRRHDREIGFAENWHTTAGKVEITALAHNELSSDPRRDERRWAE